MTQERLPIRIWLLLWVAISVVLIIAGWDNIITRSGWDPDDQLRMVQLRDFLNGQSWFDITQYRMNAPEGAPMHWSRFVELPLAFVILLLSPLFGQPNAEMVAGTLIPLIGFGLAALLLGQITTKLAGREAGIVAVVLTFFSPAITPQFRPMRIDHHGWQILMACLAYATIFWPQKKRGGIVLGLALAIWMHISLEGAPMTAAFFLLLGWRWIFEKGHGVRLFWTVASFATACAALFFGTQRSGLFAATYCDTVSPPHIIAIAIAAAVMLPVIAKAPRNRNIRIIAAAAAGMGALAALLGLAPQCSGGAFATLDPLVREYWYVHINEGLPVWHQDFASAASMLAGPICGILALAYLWKPLSGEARIHSRIAAFFLIYTFVLALLVFRTVSVTSAYAIPPTAMLIITLFSRYRSCQSPLRRVGMVALMLALFVPGTFTNKLVHVVKPATKKEAVQRDALPAKPCRSAVSVGALSALKDARIVSSFDMGPMILLTTPNEVLASSHHRNEAAMHDNIEIFRSKPDFAKTIISRRGITHIAVCADNAEMEGYVKTDPDGLWGNLKQGKTPSWLEAMPDEGDGIKLWKVKR
jgi:hypothetical protein